MIRHCSPQYLGTSMTSAEKKALRGLEDDLWNLIWEFLDSEPSMTTDSTGKAAQAAVNVVRNHFESIYPEEP